MKDSQNSTPRSKYVNQLRAETREPDCRREVGMENATHLHAVLASPNGFEKNRVIGITVNEKGRATHIHKGNTCTLNTAPEKAPVDISVGLLSEDGEVWNLNIQTVDGRIYLSRSFIAYDDPDNSNFVVMGE